MRYLFSFIFVLKVGQGSYSLQNIKKISKYYEGKI